MRHKTCIPLTLERILTAMYRLRSKWRFTTLILLIWSVYCLIQLLTSRGASVSKYHIAPFIFNLLIVSVMLPYLVCWLYAISAWMHVKELTENLQPGTERDGFARIALGLLVLVVSLIVPDIAAATYSYLGYSSSNPDWNILNNYVGILLPLLGTFLMYQGSSRIVKHIQPKIGGLAKATTVLFPVALFSVFYLFMVFSNPTRQTSTDPSVMPTYFLPDGMIVATIIAPVVANWFFGLLLVLNLEHYSHYSKIVNRSALVNFYNGVVILVGFIILSQVLTSLGNSRLNSLSLGFALALIYALIGIVTFGFGLLAHGAKGLRPPGVSAKSG
jgi:hypothetical protein